MDLNGANRTVDQLTEADIIPDYDAEAEALETWAKLVEWFFWVKGQGDDWQSAFEALPIDDPIKKLQSDLLWCWRFFAPYFPPEVRGKNWVDYGKLSFECYITSAFDYAGLTPEELGKKECFSDCLEFTKYNLMEHLEK